MTARSGRRGDSGTRLAVVPPPARRDAATPAAATRVEGDAGVTLTPLLVGGEELLAIGIPATDEGFDPAALGLTEAEGEVARGILAGRSNAQIARARGTSLRTVANQVAALFRKLGVGSRTELAARLPALRPGPRGS